MFKVLLDTNVLIRFEDDEKVISKRDSYYLRTASDTCELLVHPIQRLDIENDKDELRKLKLLNRVSRYKTLNTKTFTKDYFIRNGLCCNTTNDMIDNTLLACVNNDIVDYLVTEDKAIHKNAEKLRLSSRVMKVTDFFSLVHDVHDDVICCVENKNCREICLEDNFFDSLRGDYEGFNNWFIKKCVETDRRCWTICSGPKLFALCVYKNEKCGVIGNSHFNPGCDMLKLCTFKVDDSAYGSKMGERLLYCALKYCRNNDIDFVYLTVRESKQKFLIDFLESFGFEAFGHDGEDIIYGKFNKPRKYTDYELEPAIFNKKFYPCYMNNDNTRKFIVPIRKQFHETLFPDISDISKSLFAFHTDFFTPESFTIRKAYISTSNINTLKEGDLLLFYRSEDRHSVQVLGSVVSVFRSDDLSEIKKFTHKRTVFDDRSISRMIVNSKNSLLIILFNLVKYLEREVHFGMLHRYGIDAPQSISELSDKEFNYIMEQGDV